MSPRNSSGAASSTSSLPVLHCYCCHSFILSLAIAYRRQPQKYSVSSTPVIHPAQSSSTSTQGSSITVFPSQIYQPLLQKFSTSTNQLCLDSPIVSTQGGSITVFPSLIYQPLLQKLSTSTNELCQDSPVVSTQGSAITAFPSLTYQPLPPRNSLPSSISLTSHLSEPGVFG